MGTALAGDDTPEPTLSEQEWGRMLHRIEHGQVIPVVGEDLTVLMRDGEALSLPAYLAAELGLKLDGPAPTSLSELSVVYLRNNPRGYEDMYVDIFQALASAGATLPPALQQLAEIRDFSLFLTTSFDPCLVNALNAVRFGKRASASTHVLAYERTPIVDVPADLRQLDYALVYHLFGKVQPFPSYAVTDEDMLEFMHKLQAPECVPKNLAQLLRSHYLLVLGSRLTGWLTRFFLRISAGDRLRHAGRADYLVDASSGKDGDQAVFFEQLGGGGNIKMLPMAAPAFVAELSKRWRARHPEVGGEGSYVPSQLSTQGSNAMIFISYASEDLTVVKRLRERLEREAGVRVWVDKNSLRVGDAWELRITEVLRECSAVVLIISSNVKTGRFRYVRSEWKEAFRLRSSMAANKRFILPLVIDATSADDGAIDSDVRQLHWHRLNDEVEMQSFISDLRTL